MATDSALQESGRLQESRLCGHGHVRGRRSLFFWSLRTTSFPAAAQIFAIMILYLNVEPKLEKANSISPCQAPANMIIAIIAIVALQERQACHHSGAPSCQGYPQTNTSAAQQHSIINQQLCIHTFIFYIHRVCAPVLQDTALQRDRPTWALRPLPVVVQKVHVSKATVA